MNDKVFAVRQFVYTGIRLDTKGKRFITLKLIEDSGELGEQKHFDCSL